VMSAAIGQLAKFGMLVTRGSAIENLANVTHIIFDKTGTLTFGKLRILKAVFLNADTPEQDFAHQAIVSTMAQSSLHPAAKAIAEYLMDTQISTEASRLRSFDMAQVQQAELAGAGVEIQLDGKVYRLGRLSFVTALNGSDWHIPEAYRNKTVTVFGDEQQVLAYFVLEDTLRDEAASAVDALQKLGKKVILLSGDRDDVVADIAKQCQILDYHGGLSPAQKHQFILDLQAQRAVVAMVGDGLNDAPALAAADVGIAMSTGADVAMHSAGITLMRGDPALVADAIDLSTRTYHKIQQNLFWAFIYNVIAIPLAALGFLSPMIAGAAMAVSSVSVVLNSLLLRRWRAKRQPVTELPSV